MPDAPGYPQCAETANFAPMMQAPILVTGAAGYVGAALCRQLLAQGHRVRGLDLLLFGDAGIRELLPHPGFELLRGDLCDATLRRQALAGVQAVAHLAAIVGDPACKRFPDEATALMDVASRALHAEAEAAGVARFAFASTCSNYGLMAGDALLHEDSPLQPQSHYARLKVGFEEYLLSRLRPAGMQVQILRFATAYGSSPRMRFDLTVNHFTRDLALGRELLVFGQHQWRPYCHVQDLAHAVCLGLQQSRSGIYNIGDSGENYTKAMIVDAVLTQVPGGRVAYGPQGDPDTRNYRVDFGKAAAELGFAIRHRVPDGIAEILGGLRAGTYPDPFAQHYQNC